MKLHRRIKLDIDQEYYNLIPAQQGDTARVLNFQILNNGIPFSLENKTVRARIKKPDGNVCYNDMENINASEGECDLKLTNQILIKPGMCKVQLEIMENGEILSTIIFAIFIRESIDIKDAAESTNEFTALENGIIKLDEWDKYFKETSGQIEQKYTTELNNVKSSLASSEKKVVDVKNVFNSNINNAYLGFIFDDQRKEVYDNAYPIFKQEGIKGSIAVIVNGYKQADVTKINPRDLQIMYSNGWEFLSHGIRSLQITSSVGEDFAKSEIIQSKKELEKLGFEVNGFVAPNNLLDVNRIPYVENTYEFAFCNYNNSDVDNTKSIYNINRYDMSNKSVEQLKAIIDNAVINNKIIFFYEHNVGVEGSISVSNLTEVIQYAKSKNIVIDTPSNIIDKVSSALVKAKSLKEIAKSIDYSKNVLINPHFKGRDSASTNNWTKSNKVTTGDINVETRHYLPFSEYIIKFGGVAQNDYSILSQKIPYKSNLTTTGKLEIPIYANGGNRSFRVRVRAMNLSNYLYDLLDETIMPSLTSSIYESSFAIPKDSNITHIEIRLQVTSLVADNTFNFFVGSPCIGINNYQRDTKDYTCAYLNANQALNVTADSVDTIVFNKISISTGGLNPSTGEYTVQQDGIYKIETNISIFSTEDFVSAFNIMVILNGVASRQMKDYRSSIINKAVNISSDALLQLSAGDVIRIDLNKSLAKSLIVDRASYLNIYKIAY